MGHESIAGDNQQSEQEGLRADRRLAEPASGGGISVRLHGRHLPEKELSGVIESIAILVAIGVNSDGNREVIGATEGGREDKESFRNVESTRSVSCFTKSSIAFTSRSEINTSQ